MSYRKTYQFVAIVIVLLFAIDPNGFRPIMPLWQGFLVWVAAMATFMGVCALLFVGFAWVTIKVRKVWIFSWIISLGGFLVAQTVAVHLADHFSGGLFVRSGLLQTCFLALGVIMIETIYFRYVMPSNQAALQNPSHSAEDDRLPRSAKLHQNEHRSLTLGARTLRLEVLLYITSEEHYVRVVMRHETLVQRARLADLVAETRPSDGFQPHRSWWVSINTKPTINRDGAKPTLRLSDGTVVPIARGRVKATQDWIDAHANWDMSEITAT